MLEDRTLVGKYDRGNIRDPWPDRQQLSLAARIEINSCLHLRPRTHEAHVTHQDIPELSHFIQLEVAG